MTDELAVRREIKKMLDDIENGVVDEIPESVQKQLEMDWRILLRSAILNTKEDCTLVVYTMEQAVYGKKIAKERPEYKIQFRIFYNQMIQYIPVGSKVLV